MKTAYDIIWSDLFDDNVRITMQGRTGNMLAVLCLRFSDAVSKWKSYEVLLIEYYPLTNQLMLYIDDRGERI